MRKDSSLCHPVLDDASLFVCVAHKSVSKLTAVRYPRRAGSSKKRKFHWIPAFAGMTEKVDQILARPFILVLQIYQKTISPDHSDLGKGNSLRCCKFYPTCSEYAVQTLQKQGFIFGMPKILWRILRCHPWSRGGVDIPE